LWEDKDSQPIVYGVIAKHVNPDLGKALELLDTATEVFAKLNLNTAAVPELATANDTIKKVAERMTHLDATSPEVGVAARKVASMQAAVAKTVSARLGLSGLGF
jgi:hypothetical protein